MMAMNEYDEIKGVMLRRSEVNADWSTVMSHGHVVTS